MWHIKLHYLSDPLFSPDDVTATKKKPYNPNSYQVGELLILSDEILNFTSITWLLTLTEFSLLLKSSISYANTEHPIPLESLPSLHSSVVLLFGVLQSWYWERH
jgi:hypothetical protein